MRRRPRTPDDPGWTPLGPPPTFTDRLLDAVRLGVAEGVHRYLSDHPNVLADERTHP